MTTPALPRRKPFWFYFGPVFLVSVRGIVGFNLLLLAFAVLGI